MLFFKSLEDEIHCAKFWGYEGNKTRPKGERDTNPWDALQWDWLERSTRGKQVNTLGADLPKDQLLSG